MSSDKSISGLDNLGRCVDLVDLDPLNIVKTCKIKQAFMPKGGSDSYERGEYKIPKGVEMMSSYGLQVSGGETMMSNSYDFVRSFENEVSAEGGFQGLSFSASESVKSVQKLSESRDETFTYVFASSAIHVVALDLNGIQGQYLILNANIKTAVEKLPSVDGKEYLDFIKEYGTHFLSQVPLGGMCWSRVSAKNSSQSSSSENERILKGEAKAEVNGIKAGLTKTEIRKEVQESDKKNRLTRTDLHFVGGKGSVSEIPDEWIASLDERSVPIFNGMKLSLLSSLLTPQYFPDDAQIAAKKALLKQATSQYILRRGGEEGKRIRYGDTLQLRTTYDDGRINYHDSNEGMLPLYPSLPDGRRLPGGTAASFVITGPNAKKGDEVLTGDRVSLKIVESGGYLRLDDYVAERGPKKGEKFYGLVYKSAAGLPEGDWTIRVRGSAQHIEGAEMLTKQTPLVSGDIVLISCFDKRRQKFVTLSLGGASGVIGATSDFDYMFKPPVWSEYFSVKHC